MPKDLLPWAAVYQQTQRWLAAGCFDALVRPVDTLRRPLRAVLRLTAGRKAEPTAAIIDSRTLRSTPESGELAGYDGGKRKKGSKIHIAVDTLGHLLALHITPASAEDRGEVERSRVPCKPSQTTRSSLPESIRAIPASVLLTLQPGTASHSRSSNCRKPNAASPSYRDAGSSSGHLRGDRFRRLQRLRAPCRNARGTSRRPLRLPHGEAGRWDWRTSMTVSSSNGLCVSHGPSTGASRPQ